MSAAKAARSRSCAIPPLRNSSDRASPANSRSMSIATITAMTATPMDDFLWRATLGAALLGAAAGPLGCFVLWRRMAYLGESVAHMGLLGAALGLLLGIDPLIGVIAVAI